MSAPADQAALVIGSVVERVFRSVAEVHDGLLAGYRAAGARGARMCDRDVTALREPLLALLAREREVAVGMGVIVAPGLLADRPLRMEWWQAEEAAGHTAEPVMLEVDLNPASVGFYDYASAEWFTVPRRTGRRHVVGPYVDVHGTDRYLLTLTLPVIADGEFVGVAGADVPVARFETLVLRELGDLAADVVVVNPEDRVVFSTSARWLAGSRADLSGAADVHALPEPHWRVAVPH
ncbi:cache domain-containing protein [Pseudonocardia sp. NPDC049154]|uniref:cache domain-containing protein n=1 Tax=Pseudonocardia sp. NPDC049154 TaxID=3155501 RepID=UPI0033F4E4C6